MTHPTTTSKGYGLQSGRDRTSTPIYLPGSSKPIGHVSGLFFRKNIVGSRHILRKPPAIAFDRTTLDDAERAGATHVSVTDTETGRTYVSAIKTIRRCGFTVARGHGNQIALTLDRYSIDRAQPQAERQAAATNQERKELQLDLFGGAA